MTDDNIEELPVRHKMADVTARLLREFADAIENETGRASSQGVILIFADGRGGHNIVKPDAIDDDECSAIFLRFTDQHAAKKHSEPGTTVFSRTFNTQRFGPKSPDHPTVGERCFACNVPFRVGDMTCLYPLGPGDDPVNRQRAREDRPYNAVSLEVHWGCATGEDSGRVMEDAPLTENYQEHICNGGWFVRVQVNEDQPEEYLWGRIGVPIDLSDSKAKALFERGSRWCFRLPLGWAWSIPTLHGTVRYVDTHAALRWLEEQG